MISKETFDAMCNVDDEMTLNRFQIIEYIRSLEITDAIEAIKKVPDHLCKEKQWILHPTSYETVYGEVSWFDDFYKDRYETVFLGECIDQMQDRGEPVEKIQLFVKSWLEENCLAFYLDW